MHLVRTAIDEKRKINFAYTREDGTQSERIVWPLGLFYWGSTWTLGSWCELRESFRNFRLDRIRTITVCSEAYPNQEGRTLDDFIADAKKGY